MAKVINLGFDYRLRCHLCAGREFIIELSADEYRKGYIVPTRAICVECEEGMLDITEAIGTVGGKRAELIIRDDVD